MASRLKEKLNAFRRARLRTAEEVAAALAELLSEAPTALDDAARCIAAGNGTYVFVGAARY